MRVGCMWLGYVGMQAKEEVFSQILRESEGDRKERALGFRARERFRKRDLEREMRLKERERAGNRERDLERKRKIWRERER